MIKHIPEHKSGHNNPHKALFINNEWITGYGRQITSYDPYSKEILWQANIASATDVGRAVNAANQAFDKWARLPLAKRIEFLQAYKQALQEESEALAHVIAAETGKPLWETKNETATMISKVDISIEAYRERCPETTKDQGKYTLHTRHYPHGAVAVLGPFNFPGHLPNGHIVPALLAGNTVVFKPSEFAPYTAELMVRCFAKAKLPPGVINLIPGDGETGKMLSNQKIDGLFFTGSYSTGIALAKQFAPFPGKILALEMGGNNPLIVSQISDIEAAVSNTIQSAFITTGQRCTCARRLILVSSPKSDTFLEQLIEKTKRLKIGHYTETPEPFMGPLIHEPAAVRVIIEQGSMESHGAIPLLKCKLLKEGTGLITPGIIDVTPFLARKDQEIFGPLLQLIRVPNFTEALKEANNTDYGLSASLLSDDPAEYDLFQRRVKAGILNWNRPTTGASSNAPFGGIGHSGNHRPSAFYAADYSAYPVVSQEAAKLVAEPMPGMQP